VIDDLGRVLLPNKLRKQLEWCIGDEFSGVLTNKKLILSKNNDGGFKIDELGCIAVSKPLREQLDFEEGDKITVSLNLESKQMELSLMEKYIAECKLCDCTEETVIINRHEVCKCCIESIANSRL